MENIEDRNILWAPRIPSLALTINKDSMPHNLFECDDDESNDYEDDYEFTPLESNIAIPENTEENSIFSYLSQITLNNEFTTVISRIQNDSQIAKSVSKYRS